MPHSMSSSSLDSAAEQRDSYGVTEPRVCHAAGISPGQRGQRDHSRITKRASITWNRPSGRRKWQDITVIFVLLRLDFLLLTP